VPDNHVAVVANMYVIRDIDFDDGYTFLYSKEIKTIAQHFHLWSPGKPFDFVKIYSDGEYAHKYYSGRRVWRAFHLLAPTAAANLPAEYGNLKEDAPYPFSLPAINVTLEDVFRVHRDYLKGTPYDLSAPGNLAAGPFGTPNRYSGGAGESVVNGSWERPISLFRSTYTFVVQSLPKRSSSDSEINVNGWIWFGPHAAHGTCYVPFSATAMLDVPESYRVGNQMTLDRSAAYWAFRFVENWANLKFSYAIKDIAAEQIRLEGQSMKVQQEILQSASQGMSYRDVQEKLSINTASVLENWWRLLDFLVVKYADGYVTEPDTGKIGQSVGYPAWWLTKVGYESGPPPPLEEREQLSEKSIQIRG
jgi:dipeptidase